MKTCEPESKLLKGGYLGDDIGLIRGDTRGLDYSSCNLQIRNFCETFLAIRGSQLAASRASLAFEAKA